MPQLANIDGVLIQWGDRLFYPGNRIVRVAPQPKLVASLARRHAAAIRARIEARVVRRAPQVMVKVTGGGRGMQAIAAHFRCISKNGRLDIEDEHGETMHGKDTLHELAEDWRLGGTLITNDDAIRGAPATHNKNPQTPAWPNSPTSSGRTPSCCAAPSRKTNTARSFCRSPSCAGSTAFWCQAAMPC